MGDSSLQNLNPKPPTPSPKPSNRDQLSEAISQRFQDLEAHKYDAHNLLIHAAKLHPASEDAHEKEKPAAKTAKLAGQGRPPAGKDAQRRQYREALAVLATLDFERATGQLQPCDCISASRLP